jgi:DNA modification methylase
VNKIIQGDCLEKLKEIEDNSIDSIVTDPPYELGFMGKSWDNTGIANNPEMWAECLRVLKPGGYLLSFGGTRTYHRMAVAIEDAGFEVRDMIEWVYSTGFPKSLNLNKALQKKCSCGNMVAYDNERTKQNTEHDLRPMSESDLSQEITDTETKREVLLNSVSEQSLSSKGMQLSDKVWEGQSSVERGSNTKETEGKLQGSYLPEMSEGVFTNGEEGRLHNATQISDGSTSEQTTNENGSGASHRPQSEQQSDREPCAFCKQWGTQETRRLYEATYGVGSALKPAHEPICLARKPLSEKTLVDNFIKYRTGGINIDESRVGTGEDRVGGGLAKENFGINGMPQTERPTGARFPANLIHDNSEEVRECFPEQKSSGNRVNVEYKNPNKANVDFGGGIKNDYNDSGNASRFFKSIIYQAKASKSERNKGMDIEKEPNKRPIGEAFGNGNAITDFTETKGNNHPTVKPIALMEYLIKMVTPKGGIVLDPFAGSGSTLVAAKQNGFQYIGIEMTEEYIPIIEARLNSVQSKLL